MSEAGPFGAAYMAKQTAISDPRDGMGMDEEENRYSMVRHGSDRILDPFRKLLQTVISVRERNADFTYHNMARVRDMNMLCSYIREADMNMVMLALFSFSLQL